MRDGGCCTKPRCACTARRNQPRAEQLQLLKDLLGLIREPGLLRVVLVGDVAERAKGDVSVRLKARPLLVRHPFTALPVVIEVRIFQAPHLPHVEACFIRQLAVDSHPDAPPHLVAARSLLRDDRQTLKDHLLPQLRRPISETQRRTILDPPFLALSRPHHCEQPSRCLWHGLSIPVELVNTLGNFVLLGAWILTKDQPLVRPQHLKPFVVLLAMPEAGDFTPKLFRHTEQIFRSVLPRRSDPWSVCQLVIFASLRSVVVVSINDDDAVALRPSPQANRADVAVALNNQSSVIRPKLPLP